MCMGGNLRILVEGNGHWGWDWSWNTVYWNPNSEECPKNICLKKRILILECKKETIVTKLLIV